MADASRFPHLALPFAITGAAAGWLSAGIVQHPIVHAASSEHRLMTAGLAAGLGAVAGWLIRRWCVRKQYAWEEGPLDPNERLASDSWLRHAPVLLTAGAVAGGFHAAVSRLCDVEIGILGGVLFTLPFVPVCAAVLAAARRAQRARLGSLVAGSDRRAVWQILAIALLVCSLGALPDWPAPHTEPVDARVVTSWVLVAVIPFLAVALAADLLASRRARRAVAPGLTPRDLVHSLEEDDAVVRTDLGLGDAVHAQVARQGAVYRARERLLGLVQGDPERALGALRRAVRRGGLGLGIACVVCAAHVLAQSDGPRAYYNEIRCQYGKAEACQAAGLIGERGTLFDRADPRRAMRLYERGCDQGDGWSCMKLADLYRGDGGVDRDVALVAFFEYRAAQRGFCPEGTRLVPGRDDTCLGPTDPRHAPTRPDGGCWDGMRLVRGTESVCVAPDDPRR